MLDFSVLTKPESKEDNIQDFLSNRLPINGVFTKNNIKVTEILYDWDKRKIYEEKTELEKILDTFLEKIGEINKAADGVLDELIDSIDEKAKVIKREIEPKLEEILLFFDGERATKITKEEIINEEPSIESKKEEFHYEKTRKITIESKEIYKVKEVFSAFFINLLNLSSERHKLTDIDKMNMQSAVDDLFSENALGFDRNEKELDKLYINCKKIVFLISLENPNHVSGPLLVDFQGISIASRTGEVTRKISRVMATVLTLAALFASVLRK